MKKTLEMMIMIIMKMKRTGQDSSQSLTCLLKKKKSERMERINHDKQSIKRKTTPENENFT